MNACETCHADFSCGRLAAALKVVLAMPDLESHPELKAAYESMKRLLSEGQWRYPDALKACSFSDREPEIRKLTAKLIAELDRARVIFPIKEPHSHLLFEELSND